MSGRAQRRGRARGQRARAGAKGEEVRGAGKVGVRARVDVRARAKPISLAVVQDVNHDEDLVLPLVRSVDGQGVRLAACAVSLRTDGKAAPAAWPPRWSKGQAPERRCRLSWQLSSEGTPLGPGQ